MTGKPFEKGYEPWNKGLVGFLSGKKHTSILSFMPVGLSNYMDNTVYGGRGGD